MTPSSCRFQTLEFERLKTFESKKEIMTETFLANFWILRKNSFYQNETNQKKIIKGHGGLNQILCLSLWHFFKHLSSYGPVSQKPFSSAQAVVVSPFRQRSHGGVTHIITTGSQISFQIRFLFTCIRRDHPPPVWFSIPFIPKPSETLAPGWKSLRLKLINYDTFSVYRINSQHIGYQKSWY